MEKMKEYLAKSGAKVLYTGTHTSWYTYYITGTNEQVDEEIERLIVAFHPYGYGTYVKEKRPEKDGSVLAIVRRSWTCD